VYSYEGEMGPGHSAEIPLFWATHKGTYDIYINKKIN